MRKITVTVDNETYRRSRTRAAELGTSVPALLRAYLEDLAADSAGGSSTETPPKRRRRLLREVTDDFERRGVGLDMAGNLPRSELYDRGRARAGAATAGQKRRPVGSAAQPDPPQEATGAGRPPQPGSDDQHRRLKLRTTGRSLSTARPSHPCV